MEQRAGQVKATEIQGLKFYGPDDELPPGAVEALRRRTHEELQAAADRANRRS